MGLLLKYREAQILFMNKSVIAYCLKKSIILVKITKIIRFLGKC